VEVVVGQPATVTVGVPAEGLTPVVAVDIAVPDGFTLDGFVPSGEWSAQREGEVLHVRGGRIVGGACGFLLVRGTATRSGTLRFAMTTHDEDGTVRHLDQADLFNPRAAMVVESHRPGRGSGAGSLAVPLGVLGLLGLAGLLALRARRRHRRGRGNRGAGRPAVRTGRSSTAR
jgi:hypothetical protein